MGLKPPPHAQQRGAVTVLMLACLLLLMGLLGLLADVSMLLLQRRKLQTAADMAAVAAGMQIGRGYPQTVLSTAWADVHANGFSAQGGDQLLVSVPPAQGPFMGRAQHVQVQLQHTLPLSFLQRFGFNNPLLQASATAKVEQMCLLQLSGLSVPGVVLDNDAMLQMPQCRLQVNAAGSEALTLGKRALLSAAQVSVHGGVSLANAAVLTPAPLTAVPVMADPFSSWFEPTPVSCLAIDLNINDTRVLQPGTYCGGIHLGKKAQVTLAPGVYILLGGGLSVVKNAQLLGQQVFFFNTFSSAYPLGAVSLDDKSNVQLSAPETGPHQGWLLAESRSVPVEAAQVHQLGFSDTSLLEGLLYSPHAAIAFTGLHNAYANTQARYFSVLAATVSVSGGISMKPAVIGGVSGGFYRVRLVE